MDITNIIVEYIPYALGVCGIVSSYIAYKVYNHKPKSKQNKKKEPPLKVDVPPPSELTKPRLQVQPIPKDMFGINARSCYPSEWRLISQRVRSKNQCDVCECYLPPKNLDAHEVWDFVLIDGVLTQRLIDIQCLCKKCHALAHPRRSLVAEQKEGKDVTDIRMHAQLIMGTTLEALCEQQSREVSQIQKQSIRHNKHHYPYALDDKNRKIIYYELDLRYLNHKYGDIIKTARHNEMQYFDFNNKKSYET